MLCNQVVVRVRPQVLGTELQQGMITCIGAVSMFCGDCSYSGSSSSSTATTSCVCCEGVSVASPEAGAAPSDEVYMIHLQPTCFCRISWQQQAVVFRSKAVRPP
jgi:hypothetical protein